MTWTRREFTKATAFLAMLGPAGGFADTSDAPSPLSVTAAGYKSWFVVDGCGGPGEFTEEDDAPLSASAVADVCSSGLTCVNLTVGPVGNMPAAEALQKTMREIAYWLQEIENHPEAMMQVRKKEHIEAAKTSGRLGVIFGLQDGVIFQDDLSMLKVLRGLGVLIIQPTYNLRNLLGDGCLEPGNAGLSRIGHEAIERLNGLGILIDLSHCGARTTDEALAASKKPVAFTHTGCAAVYDHPRNKSDEQLRALADKGGVAGIFVMPYLRQHGQPTAEDVVRHVEHAIRIAGEDHFGVGTDGQISPVRLTPAFLKYWEKNTENRKKSGIAAPGEDLDAYLFAKDLNTPRKFETLADLLSRRGHPGSRIEKILGGNFVRLLREVWI